MLLALYNDIQNVDKPFKPDIRCIKNMFIDIFIFYITIYTFLEFKINIYIYI